MLRSSDGEQECVYVCSCLSEDDFIVSTLRGEKTKVMHIPPATVMQRIESSC